MNIPINQEHIEAEQCETTKKKEKYVATLSKEEAKKFEAVEDAIKILLAAKVDFYLFPLLPAPSYNEPICWQWNSLPATSVWENNGSLSEKSKQESEFLNTCLCKTFYYTFHDPDVPFEDQFHEFINRFYNALITFSKQHTPREYDKGV